LVTQFKLCPKLCLVHTSKEPCHTFEGSCCKGACEQKETSKKYNNRVEMAIQSLTTHESYAIIDKGLYSDELSCIVIEKGKFYGMGYLPIDAQRRDLDYLKEMVTAHKHSFYIHDLLQSAQLVGNAKIIELQ
jgi:DNA polymerase III subunit epsilon